MEQLIQTRPSGSQELPGSWDVTIDGKLVARCADRWVSSELREVLASAYALTTIGEH